MAQNPYYVEPANIMPGVSAVASAIKGRGARELEAAKERKALAKEEQKEAEEQAKRAEGAQLLETGTPEEIASFMVKNPEAGKTLGGAVKFKSDETKQRLLDDAIGVYTGKLDPFETSSSRVKSLAMEGADPSDTLEIAKTAAVNPEDAVEEYGRVWAAYDPEGFMKYQKAMGLGPAAETKDTRTTDIKDYEYAQGQGFKGSFADFRKADKAMSRETTAEIRNYEYGLENPDFAKLKISADENRLTEHELRLATMLANGEIDASQLPKRGATYNKIVSGAKELNPDLDIRSATADYALSKNPQFRQKTMTAEVLPDIMQHVVDAGKKVDFSNLRKIGGMQKFYKENVNDPDFVEYMALRNDALMEIASVMRGGGMTDKAHEAEVEAMNPTMSPRALDAWMKAQTKALKPRLEIMQKVISGKGEKQRQEPKTPIPKEITTQADFDRLPPGAGYLENGVLFRKPL